MTIVRARVRGTVQYRKAVVIVTAKGTTVKFLDDQTLHKFENCHVAGAWIPENHKHEQII